MIMRACYVRSDDDDESSDGMGHGVVVKDPRMELGRARGGWVDGSRPFGVDERNERLKAKRLRVMYKNVGQMYRWIHAI
jgi:hypothetical protein